MSILITVLIGLWMIVAMLMMLVILMQRPKSEGLGAAFGGAVTENLFGAQTTNVLVKFTAWLAGIFFAITFTLSVLYAHRSLGGSSLSRELKKTAPAAQAPAGSPSAATSPDAAISPVAGAPVQTAPAANASAAPSVSAIPAGGRNAPPGPVASVPPKP
jgi:preprotein translocase subunit SecG